MTDVALDAPFRAATPADAEAMVDLVNYAGEGMPMFLWARMAGDGQSARDMGIERAKRESGGFSFNNTVLCQPGDEVVAALIGYCLDDDPEAGDYDELPPMFVPLQQLEDLAPGTWYINVLATYPAHRGKGWGAALLDVAEQLAQATKARGMSLIVSDANTGARRLYERQGYEERATRPMVKDGWENPGENWVLLVKPF